MAATKETTTEPKEEETKALIEDAFPGTKTDDPFDSMPDDSIYRDLLKQVNRDVDGWRPSPGETVRGVVVDLTEGESEFGTYPLIILDSPDNEALIGVHCFHAVLKNDIQRRIERDALEIGSIIAISYRGEGNASTGKSAPNMYRVAVMPPRR